MAHEVALPCKLALRGSVRRDDPSFYGTERLVPKGHTFNLFTSNVVLLMNKQKPYADRRTAARVRVGQPVVGAGCGTVP